jgi:hypothetical protein
MTGEHVIETPDETWPVERLLEHIDSMRKEQKFVFDGYERRGMIIQMLIAEVGKEDGIFFDINDDSLAQLLIREAAKNGDFVVGDDPWWNI